MGLHMTFFFRVRMKVEWNRRAFSAWTCTTVPLARRSSNSCSRTTLFASSSRIGVGRSRPNERGSRKLDPIVLGNNPQNPCIRAMLAESVAVTYHRPRHCGGVCIPRAWWSGRLCGRWLAQLLLLLTRVQMPVVAAGAAPVGVRLVLLLCRLALSVLALARSMVPPRTLLLGLLASMCSSASLRALSCSASSRAITVPVSACEKERFNNSANRMRAQAYFVPAFNPPQCSDVIQSGFQVAGVPIVEPVSGVQSAHLTQPLHNSCRDMRC